MMKDWIFQTGQDVADVEVPVQVSQVMAVKDLWGVAKKILQVENVEELVEKEKEDL